MRNIFSEKNQSIYAMTKEETDMDKREALALGLKGIGIGIGGFCTLWVTVALYIHFVVGPPIPDVPIVVTIEDLMLESYEIERLQQLTDPPVTIPSKPDEEEWITVKKLVKE